MNIYLASRYSRIEQMRSYRELLESLGHKVCSRWIDGEHKITPSGSVQADDAERQRFAVEDWHDMLQSDMVISFTEEPRKTNTRGGRHVEFGGAIAAGKKLVVIGYRENVFHHLPSVNFHENWSDFYEFIQKGLY